MGNPFRIIAVSDAIEYGEMPVIVVDLYASGHILVFRRNDIAGDVKLCPHNSL